jgi:hypothetical protein
LNSDPCREALPHSLDPVLFKDRIGSYDGKPLIAGLSNQQTIERVSMMGDEALDPRHLVESNRQQFEVVPRKLLREK